MGYVATAGVIYAGKGVQPVRTVLEPLLPGALSGFIKREPTDSASVGSLFWGIPVTTGRGRHS